MIYLAFLLLILSACGETPTGPSGPYGRIETFAGTGDAGKGPEEPTLRQAVFYLPQDLTYGPDGRLYILDWNNHRVRVVANGRISTLIGTRRTRGRSGRPGARDRPQPSDPHLLRPIRDA